MLLAIAAGLGAYQVLMRFILQQPSTWSEALTRTLLIWMVYLGAALAVRAGLLVAVDVIRAVSGGATRKALELAALLCSLVFFAVVAWYGYEMTALVRFQTLAGLEVSISWAYAALPVGGLLAAMLTIGTILRLLTGWRSGDDGPRVD
jgi:TRAP-type C4-dicarboxylate transport system permease small subunit